MEFTYLLSEDDVELLGNERLSSLAAQLTSQYLVVEVLPSNRQPVRLITTAVDAFQTRRRQLLELGRCLEVVHHVRRSSVSMSPAAQNLRR